MSIEVRNVVKRFGSFEALAGVNLEVASGELLALLGPSGSGKTTLLRVLAGLDEPDSGQVFLAGEDATEQHVRERQVGFVFQHYALFRHMSIFENIAFGLRVRPKESRPSDREIAERVHQLLDLVQLGWVADRFPHQLSGGQRQRVALARALAVEPRVLLLDEPFGALDAKVRQELRGWLRRLHDDLHITSVFVTHDQEEALEVADRVVILDKGRIIQSGSPVEVYHDAVNPFVYQFLGPANRLVGKPLAQLLLSAGTVQENGGLGALVRNGTLDSQLVGFVRPHDVLVHRERQPEGGLHARVELVRPLGQLVWLSLRLDDFSDVILRAQLPWRDWQLAEVPHRGTVWVRLRHVHLFKSEPEVAWVGDGSNI